MEQCGRVYGERLQDLWQNGQAVSRKVNSGIKQMAQSA